MKRSRGSVMSQSPSSSTPACSRHGMEVSPLFTFTRDSDTDNSADHSGLQISPLLSKNRLSAIPYPPLEVETHNLVKAGFHANGSIDTPSPDGHSFGVDLSDRSIGKGYLSDHLRHSLSYARHMEQRAMHLSARINQSANLSMSPRLLFTPDTNSTAGVVDSASEQRKKASMVDDLNMQSYLSISQQTASTVERYARLADVCPDVLNRPTVNRFMTRFIPGERHHEERPVGINPIFNCNNLAGSFSNLTDISRTRLAVLYKARHRLSGVLYCLKRSRCDFELDRPYGRIPLLRLVMDFLQVFIFCPSYQLLLAGDIAGIMFKLADFGRASRAGEDRDGEDLGDGRYLPRLNDPSPPARAATGRDLYALGITLYHSAGGPMSASVWEKLRETECLPDLSVLPNSLMSVVKGLLRPLAQDRPTAAELVTCALFRPYVSSRTEGTCYPIFVDGRRQWLTSTIALAPNHITLSIAAVCTVSTLSSGCSSHFVANTTLDLNYRHLLALREPKNLGCNPKVAQQYFTPINRLL
ncbi:Wee1 protein kinase [Fasciola gigantica]|uniref:Wee1 protein kinase n=1 Tax=Fasciola gigantica TaxID=46835 RepID=A0A504Z4A7_FASGI|nr:Wee1 protein kinase [Fasciola gigantica]